MRQSISAYASMRQDCVWFLATRFCWDRSDVPDFFRASPPLRPISAKRRGSILANPFAVFILPPKRPSATAAGFFILFFGIISERGQSRSRRGLPAHVMIVPVALRQTKAVKG